MVAKKIGIAWGMGRVYFGINHKSKIYKYDDMTKIFSRAGGGTTKFKIPSVHVDMSKDMMEMRTLCQVIINRR